MSETPTNKEIYLAFQRVSLSAFGGALPWAKIIVVDRLKWLTVEEFADVLSLCQFSPGPNIVNVAAVIGYRFNGVRGAVAAFLGLLTVPFILNCSAGFLYSRLSGLHTLAGVLGGIGAVAAGLFLTMAIQLGLKLFKTNRSFIGFSAMAFLATVVLHLHIVLTLALLSPFALARSFMVKA